MDSPTDAQAAVASHDGCHRSKNALQPRRFCAAFLCAMVV
jgi:hypothetical protein